ncbi:uncharacterized protein LOC125945014 [Dermacentor silvarum]|uniref:uncharacterized protein LOC125945014 n=1 Tax=Dermacentor silvarum TaxID=543639 RepID=UPI0021007940|nr:uncharacterized protein LOC125945014 [Dermacentor silvarum]
MGGRWYVPKNPPTSVSLGDECSHANSRLGEQIDSVLQVCADRGFNSTFYHDATYEASVSYDSSKNWLFTYDSALSLRSKLCKTKRTAVHVDYTLAAANIQFEDFMNYCGFGPYGRLVMLKTLANFLTRNYTSADKEGACMALS